MTLRSGRFGKFLGCKNYPECKGILNLDPKKGTIKLPKTPPFVTDLPCPKCDAPLNMRDSKRGFWLSCSKFPKCRGRGTWAPLPDERKEALTRAWEAHVAANPVPDAYLNALFPAIVENHLTVGVGYKVAEAGTFDISLAKGLTAEFTNPGSGVESTHGQLNLQLIYTHLF